jgi:hypothetical protein
VDTGGGGPHPLHRRHQKRHQARDYGDHDQQKKPMYAGKMR